MVEDMHLYTSAYQLGRYVSLKIGETQNQIGLQCKYLIQLRARERGDLGFFFARASRPDGETGDSNYPMIFLQKIQCLSGLFCETDDTLWELFAHY